jgi:hypothetical protein
MNKPRTSATKATPSPSSRNASTMQKSRTPTKQSSTLSNEALDTPTNANRGVVKPVRSEPGAVSTAMKIVAIDNPHTAKKHSDLDDDVTIRNQSSVPGESRAATGSTDIDSVATEPESSDELERICENIWNLFGDNLRYVAVDREGADYQETLRIVRDLSLGGSSSAEDGDLSMVSSSNGSQATAATSGSTGSTMAHLDNAGPPSPTIAIAAHALYTLLTTPAPHVMEFDELKSIGEAWWASVGREALRTASMGREIPTDIDDATSSLTNKAVYSLIAKKLLRLQFRASKRLISFPAVIV